MLDAPFGELLAELSDPPDLFLAIYLVTSWKGEPTNRVREEHDQVG